jgi:DNA-binding NarL/FixJ family response regulator
MKKVYVVELTEEEQTELLELVGKGKLRARKINRAHILLLANDGRTDKHIAQALHTSPSTLEW